MLSFDGNNRFEVHWAQESDLTKCLLVHATVYTYVVAAIVLPKASVKSYWNDFEI